MSRTVDSSYIIYSSAVRTSFRKCKLNSFSPQHCARRSVRAKYRKQLRKLVGSTLEPFHGPSEAPKSAQEQEDRRWRRKRQSPTCCRDSGPKERKVEKAEGEGPCHANAILKLL